MLDDQPVIYRPSWKSQYKLIPIFILLALMTFIGIWKNSFGLSIASSGIAIFFCFIIYINLRGVISIDDRRQWVQIGKNRISILSIKRVGKEIYPIDNTKMSLILFDDNDRILASLPLINYSPKDAEEITASVLSGMSSNQSLHGSGPH